MRLKIDVACGCNTGRIRRNNEDNLYFRKQHLPVLHNGTLQVLQYSGKVKHRECFAVFDGMGGENFGEEAAYAAAYQLHKSCNSLVSYFLTQEQFLNQTIMKMNCAVVEKKKEYCTERMGATFVMASFERNTVWICNLGDSRGYLLRNRKLKQASVDHVEKYPGRRSRKAPLTQYLGIDPEEICIEPYLERIDLMRGDQLLLCSDGLTDMLSNLEITAIMLEHTASQTCVQALIDAAMANGGRDNITAMVVAIR